MSAMMDPIPNRIRGFFGLPCRFPATPSILARRCIQVYDPTRFFGVCGVPKNFFRVFPARQGKIEAALPGPVPPLWRRDDHRLGSYGPIPARIVAAQPAPLARKA